ncbi:MAG: thermonuclease family protein [Gammaproteobacteria bacterium]
MGLILLLYSQHGLGGACPARDSGERVTVVHVYDGDTVKLADGRRVRLIGINAPELRADQLEGEPFADEARAALETLINRNNRILLLQYGREHEDHYGRLLAHAFVDNGDNVAVQLLQAGLATTLVVPPNTWAHNCYQQQEDQARIERRGIWDHPRYQVLDSRSLPAATRGFRLIHATVQRVRYAGGTAWLELDGPLTVRVGKQDQVNFPTGYLEHLAGQAVELRGWVRARPSGLIMIVRHPAALAAISTQAP